ncbi:hypothetical protein EUZ93_04730 [Wolbachia pipientis]|nr:hypothetical protein [Wolbachia pipientis]
MPGTVKKSKSNEKDINQQLYNTIYKKVTKENHKYASPQKGDGTIKKCIELFKQEADPNVLSELEKLLSKQIKLEKLPEKKEEYQKHYKYYIEDFLPALKTGVMELEVKPSVSNNEIEQLQKSPTRRAQILQIISGIIKRSSSVSSIPSAVEENIEDQMQLKHIEEQNNTQEIPLNVAEKKSGDKKILSNSDVTEEVLKKYSKVVEEIEEKQTSKLSSGSDLDSGIELPRTNEESLESPVSSRRSSLTLVTSTSSEESLNSTLNSVEEDNGLQPEDEGETKLAHLTKTRAKGPSGRRSPSKHHEKKDPMQPEEKEEKAVSSKQEASKDILSKKQSNDRNLHVALAAGCALLAVGCLVAAAIAKSGILCVIGAVFAIEAITTWCLTPSSELTSTNLSRPVDDKELTAL